MSVRSKWPALWLSASVFASVAGMPADASAHASCKAHIVMDAGTGDVYSSRNADESCYPASLTKVMTAYVIFEELDKGNLFLDDKMIVSENAASMPAVTLDLSPGDTITVRQALDALLILSANDVAVVVAEEIEGGETDFVERMNEVARSIGMLDTTYGSASGLDNPQYLQVRDGQLTTAIDQARLALALLGNHADKLIFFEKEGFEYEGKYYETQNRFIAPKKNKSFADNIADEVGLILGKTGFTYRARHAFLGFEQNESDGSSAVIAALGSRTRNLLWHHVGHYLGSYGWGPFEIPPRRLEALLNSPMRRPYIPEP